METDPTDPNLEPQSAVPTSEPAFDSVTARVLAQLEQQPQERTWLKSLGLLVVSLLIFAATGFFNEDPKRLVLLIGVLLFHELGHYAGMRFFNYQDVRMFFIPLFGAAVAGRPRSVEGYKEAIVLLLGPLPGIVLGAALAVVGIANDSPLLRSLALLLLVLNGFNLLPFLPLDGGRLLHLVLFSRQPYLEALFRVVTGGLVVYLGWSMGAWMLALVGAFIVFGTGYVFRVSRIARLLRGSVEVGGLMDLSALIPREQAVPLIELVRRQFPQMLDPAQLANTVRQVWERMHQRPPGLAVSLLLLLVYAGGLLAATALALIVAISQPDDQRLAELIGQPAAPLAVETWVNGAALTDDDLQGKVVLLDFWAVWCGPCIASFPHLREWHEKYGEKGLVMIGVTNYYNFQWDDATGKVIRSDEPVSHADEQAMLAKFAQSHNLQHRIALERDREMSDHYAVGGIPQVVVIDQQGTVRLIKVGASDRNAAAIGKLLDELLGS